MKAKKLIALLLTGVMTLGSISQTAFAEEFQTAEILTVETTSAEKTEELQTYVEEVEQISAESEETVRKELQSEDEISAEVPVEETIEIPVEAIPESPAGEITEAPSEAPTKDLTEAPNNDLTETTPAEPAEEITEDLTEEITEDITEEITEDLTEEITEDLTEEPSEEPTEEPASDLSLAATTVVYDFPFINENAGLYYQYSIYSHISYNRGDEYGAVPITDVKIRNAVSGGKKIWNIEQSADGTWNYIFNGYGHVYLDLYYTTVSGTTTKKTYDLHVIEKHGSVYIKKSIKHENIYSGQTVDLIAFGNLYESDGSTTEDLDFNQCEFEWTFLGDGGANAFTINQDKEKPYILHVTAATKASGEPIGSFKVCVYDYDKNGKRVKINEATEYLSYVKSYYEIHYGLEGQYVVPGKEYTIQPRLYMYSAAYPNGKMVNGSVQFDQCNNVEIRTTDGKLLRADTILSTQNLSLKLKRKDWEYADAYFSGIDQNGEYVTWDYWFMETPVIDIELVTNDEDMEFSANENVTVSVKYDSLSDLGSESLSMKYVLLGEDRGGNVKTLPATCYTIDTKGNITLKGSEIKKYVPIDYLSLTFIATPLVGGVEHYASRNISFLYYKDSVEVIQNTPMLDICGCYYVGEDTTFYNLSYYDEKEDEFYYYNITSAKVVSATGGTTDVFTLKSTTGGGWSLHANKIGQAYLALSYTDHTGKARTSYYTVEVEKERLIAEIISDELFYDLKSGMTRDYYLSVKNIGYDSDGYYNALLRDARIEWEVQDNNPSITLNVDNKNPYLVHITAKDVKEDTYCSVGAYIYCKDANGEEYTAGSAYIGIEVCAQTRSIVVESSKRDELRVGDTATYSIWPDDKGLRSQTSKYTNFIGALEWDENLLEIKNRDGVILHNGTDNDEISLGKDAITIRPKKSANTEVGITVWKKDTATGNFEFYAYVDLRLTVIPTTTHKELKITRQPVNAFAPEAGQTAMVSVGATGEGLTYTWYYKNPGSTKYIASSSTSNSSSYKTTMTEARDGRKVFCKIQDKYGNIVRTKEVTLKIGAPTELKITKQLTDIYVAEAGDTAKMTISAQGDGLTYKWYYKNPGASSFSASSVTTKTYSIAITEARDGRQSYCVVKDEYGNTVKSNVVTLRIHKDLKITKQPVTTTVVQAGDAAKLSVTAEGDALTYTWYYKDVNATSYTASTQKNQTNIYSTTVTAARNGRKIYCRIKDKYGNEVKTNTVTLKIRTELKITRQPVSTKVAQADDTAKLTVAAQGDGLTYTWYYKNPGATSFSKSDITTNTYSISITKARNGRQMYCKVTDKYGNTVKSNTVTLTIAQ